MVLIFEYDRARGNSARRRAQLRQHLPGKPVALNFRLVVRAFDQVFIAKDLVSAHFA